MARSNLNFIGDVTVADDAANDRITVTIGGAGPTAYYPNTPAHYGLLSFSAPPETVSATAPVNAGWGYYVKILVPFTQTFASMVVMQSAGSTGGANMYLGLYDQSGTRLGVSADQSSVFTAAQNRAVTLTADSPGSLTVTGSTSQYVWAGLLIGTQSTTPVTYRATSAGSGAAGNPNVTGSSQWAGSLGTGLTALPTSFAPGSLTAAQRFWVGLK